MLAERISAVSQKAHDQVGSNTLWSLWVCIILHVTLYVATPTLIIT